MTRTKKLTETKMKLIRVETISELMEKVKHARRGTTYILIDRSRQDHYVGSRTDLMEEIKYLEMMLQVQRHLGVVSYPAIVFRKDKPRKSK